MYKCKRGERRRQAPGERNRHKTQLFFQFFDVLWRIAHLIADARTSQQSPPQGDVFEFTAPSCGKTIYRVVELGYKDCETESSM